MEDSEIKSHHHYPDITEVQRRYDEIINLTRKIFEKQLHDMGTVMTALRAKVTILQETVTRARAEEARLRDEIADTREASEQAMSTAQGSFDSQLTELGRLAWAANSEAAELSLALKKAHAENLRLCELIIGT